MRNVLLRLLFTGWAVLMLWLSRLGVMMGWVGVPDAPAPVKLMVRIRADDCARRRSGQR